LLALFYLWILLLVGATAVFAWGTRIVLWNSDAKRAIGRITAVSQFGYIVLCAILFVMSLLSGVGDSLPTALELPILTVRFSRLLVPLTVLAVGPWFVTAWWCTSFRTPRCNESAAPTNHCAPPLGGFRPITR
jgi:hypothetical protein